MKGKEGFALAAVIFVVDQFTKWLVAGPIGLTELGQNIHVLPFFDLTRVHNHGISLGLLSAGSETGRWLLVANYRSNRINLFAVDRDTGRLSDTGQSVESPAPVSVTFLH